METPEIQTDQAVPETPSSPVTPKVEAPAPSTEKKFTRRERLEFTLNKIQSQLEELDKEEDDTRPVTVGDLKRMNLDQSKKTALEMAASIEDDLERTEVMEVLETRIQPSGDPDKDLSFARAAVNAVRTERALEEQARRVSPTSHASRPAAPGPTEERFEPTPTEAIFMARYNLTKEDIIKARKS